jgi:hypothetical protein
MYTAQQINNSTGFTDFNTLNDPFEVGKGTSVFFSVHTDLARSQHLERRISGNRKEFTSTHRRNSKKVLEQRFWMWGK